MFITTTLLSASPRYSMLLSRNIFDDVRTDKLGQPKRQFLPEFDSSIVTWVSGANVGQFVNLVKIILIRERFMGKSPVFFEMKRPRVFLLNAF